MPGGGGSYLRGLTSDPVIHAVRAFKCPMLILMYRLASTCPAETRGCCLVAPPGGISQ